MNKKFLLIFWFSFAFTAQALSPYEAADKIKTGTIKAVIFDVNGVLLDRSTWASLSCLSFRSIAHALSQGEAFWRKDIIFSRLNQVSSNYQGPVLYHDGYAMPNIMAEWQTGLITGNEALLQCQKELDEEAVLPEILDLIFNPQTLARVHELNPLAWDLLSILKHVQMPIYILSNMDLETAELLMSKFPEVFNSAKAIMWSAEVHLAKPDPEIFLRALNQFVLDAESTLFIDDEMANRMSAEKLGINTMAECHMGILANLLETNF